MQGKFCLTYKKLGDKSNSYDFASFNMKVKDNRTHIGCTRQSMQTTVEW